MNAAQAQRPIAVRFGSLYPGSRIAAELRHDAVYVKPGATIVGREAITEHFSRSLANMTGGVFSPIHPGNAG
jgi:hypothetical protein